MDSRQEGMCATLTKKILIYKTNIHQIALAELFTCAKPPQGKGVIKAVWMFVNKGLLAIRQQSGERNCTLKKFLKAGRGLAIVS